MLTRWITSVLGAVACLAWACAECDREGCERLSQRVAEGETGISGVVAGSSDVVADGCNECPFGAAPLQIWRADAAITTASAAVALSQSRAPDREGLVSGRYSQSLEPGAYLFCVRPSCVGVTVTSGEAVTVNIKRRDGATGFFVGAPGDDRLQEDFGFEIGF